MSTRPTTKPSNLREDLKLFLAKPDVPLADFVTPLTLEECIDRLYSMRVAWLDTTVDLQVESFDTNRHSFHLHMNQKRGKRIIDDAVTGTMQRLDAQTTQVTIMRDYTPANLVTWKRAMAVLGVILLVIFLFDKVIFVLSLIMVAMWFMKNDHRAVASMIKRALAAPTPDDTINPDTP